ncbi:MAG TPA: hypothetical protein VK465_16630, partial [Fibrobacteria bacterium]|nr:hypothetical protein [Fibrobacteria bacterium]
AKDILHGTSQTLGFLTGALGAGDSRFLAVGSKRVQNSQGYWDPEKALFLTSTDGAAWSEINPEAVGGFPARLTGAAYGNDEYLAIGQSKIEGDMYGALTPANRVVISRVSAGDACKATYLGNGTIEFEVKFAAPQQYVEVFVRQNGLQNVAQNIVNSVVNNGDGSFTYKFTRGGYAPGEFVEYRFYSYIQNGPRVFTPGPVENVWKNLVVNN